LILLNQEERPASFRPVTGGGKLKVITDQQEEEWLTPVLYLHQSEDTRIVNTPEVVDNWFPVIDHSRAVPAAELDHPQYRCRTSRAEKRLDGSEGEAKHPAARQVWRVKREGHWHPAGIECRQLARGVPEQKRVDTVEALEGLAVPAEMLEEAVQRVAGREAHAPPPPDHRRRVHTLHRDEASERFDAGDVTSLPVGEPRRLGDSGTA
jgi:hypothetical protein